VGGRLGGNRRTSPDDGTRAARAVDVNKTKRSRWIDQLIDDDVHGVLIILPFWATIVLSKERGRITLMMGSHGWLAG